MKQVLIPSTVFISVAIAALGQEAPRSARATAEELEAARKCGAETALADAKRGEFSLPFTQLPKGEPWLPEWLLLLQTRGFKMEQSVCLTGATAAQLEYFVVHSEAFDKVMIEQIKLHFGNDFFARLNAEAKAIHEAKNAPKPSTRKAR